MLSLIAKYDTPTPRYTAYPPANYFTEEFTPADYLREVDGSNSQGSSHISIYIHVPFCEKLCYYCGCNSYPKAPQNIVDAYVEAMKREMTMILSRLDPSRRIAQIHYGGGTPNTLSTTQLADLNRHALSLFRTIDSPEIAIECHPALLTPEYIEGLKQAGFNRFSLGIQDFDTAVLRTVNRSEPAMPVGEIVKLLRDGRPDMAVNLDFIYGLPGQSVEGFSDTIRKALEIHPDRLVTFSYAHVPWVNKNQMILEKAGLPDAQAKTAMYLAARDLLTSGGYEAIGIDHYVLPQDELYEAQTGGTLHRNFQGYCTRRTTGQVYAFGVSGISQMESCYAQNTKSIPDYIEAVNAGRAATVKGYLLSPDEKAIRTMLTELMCNNRLGWGKMASETGRTAAELKALLGYDASRLKGFADDGIVVCTEEGIRITDMGRTFTRNVAAALDPLLQRDRRRFSRSV